MLRNLLKGSVLVALVLSVATVSFSPRAHATMAIEYCMPYTFRIGSGGRDCIKMIQSLMNEANIMYGYNGTNPGWPILTVDGSYGTQTAKAVKSYQFTYNVRNRANLAMDGVVGRQTWWAIADDCVNRWPARDHRSFYCVNG